MSNNTPDYEDNLVIDPEKAICWVEDIDDIKDNAVIYLGDDCCDELKKENKMLKNLLKECVPYVNHGFMETRETLTKPYTASDRVLHKKAEKLLTKIDEAIK